MLTHTNSFDDLASLVAAAADLCIKPWRHAVVDQRSMDEAHSHSIDLIELILRIESRSPDGTRCPEQDLELEIFQSGDELNLILSWSYKPENPILWQGQHPVWMDGESGRLCKPPNDSEPMEALARKLRSSISSFREL